MTGPGGRGKARLNRPAVVLGLVGALLLPLVCAASAAPAPAAATQSAPVERPSSAAGGGVPGVATGRGRLGAAAGGAAAGATAVPGTKAGARSTGTAPPAPPANPLVRPSVLDRPPLGHSHSADQIQAIAARVPKVAAVVRAHRGSYPVTYEKGAYQWQVSYFDRVGGREIAQVLIDDSTGQVREAWTGFQVAWSMARGYPGAFGRRVNALYVWIPLSLLFLAPFVDWRRPRRMLHLDLAVLLLFSVSLAFFNNADIYRSVPLAYPPLLYLLGRMLWIGLRRRPPGWDPPPRLHLAVPVSWLTIGLVFLIGFRIALNVTDSNVIDVGYAGVIGAQRISDGQGLYGTFPSENQHGDTYGPTSYEAYVPFVEAFGYSGRWDDLPAAHGAAVAFDLACIGLIFLIGRLIRGPTLGVVLAYAWAAYPFTLFAAESNTNDSLVAALILAALLFSVSPPARGVLAALAGLTKFAPLAIAPLLATHGLREEPSRRRRLRAVLAFGLAFAAASVLAFVPALAHDSVSTIYDRTVAYQAARGSPFSIWGLYGGLGGLQTAVQLAAVLLAVVLALVPRRPDVIGLAALVAAVVIALQLGITHWFYLYVPWFFAPAIVALLARYDLPDVLPSRSAGRLREA
ncbi:MAG: hypothetical protein QOF77_1433 [Solirubrobacteraceae bacterium]|nr:hypothetical protein [Solirubrobacteraceae bacterium]